MHQTEILGYLRRLTGNPTAAEDLFQDTFLRAFRGFARLRPGSNHRAWLYRIATNLFLNHRRAAGRRAEVALPPELISTRPSPCTVHDGVASLAAFIQRQLHGLSYREVGTALGCTAAAARANVYQAVRRLRRERDIFKGRTLRGEHRDMRNTLS